MLGFLRDIRTIRVVGQLVFIVGIGVLMAWVVGNMRAGLEAANIPTTFSFLDRESGFQINEGIVSEPHLRSDSYAHAFAIGLINTMRVIVFGLILSTALGLVMGVARLSSNWLVRNIAVVYIEVMQNTPLLVQLIFLYAGILPTLPPIRNAIELPGPSYLSVKGLATPAFVPTETTLIWYVFVVIGVILGGSVWRRRRRIRIETGKVTYAAEIGLAILAASALIGWLVVSLAGAAPFTVSVPRIGNFNYARGEGAILSPEFFAIIVGLVLYTGAFIAEVVRSGIQSVSFGQWEAARTQGFTYFQTLRLIILPQALRVAIPPLTNQYLNLAKNSSLGAAVAYAELFGIARTMQESVPVVPVILIVMGTYLVISLITAAIMNMLNARFQIKTR